MMGSWNFTNDFGAALENYVTLNITHEVHTWKLNVGTKNHGPFSNCDWTAALFWCMFWRVSIRHISGVWNIQFPVDHSIFLRHFEDQPDCSESSSAIPPKTEMGYPSFEWKLWSRYFSPCFLWCFYIRLRFPQIIWPDFTFLQIPNRPLILVGSGELSTEKLWSQVSEANLMGLDVLKNVGNVPLDLRDYDPLWP